MTDNKHNSHGKQNIMNIHFYNFQMKLDGYDFPVYTTEFCPKNQTEWNERSSAINCTESNGYMCLPSENITMLLEFCYTYPSIFMEEGEQLKNSSLRRMICFKNFI